MADHWIRTRVVRKQRETDDISSFVLADVMGHPLPLFTAGAHVDVLTPGGHVRQYSLCSNPTRQDQYMIAVLREPASRGGSRALQDDLREGDLLDISEPRNHFPLVTSSGKALLLGAGIGITPLLCMAQRLANVGADFELHYSARSRLRMAFHDRLRASSFADKVHLHLSDEASRLDAEVLLRRQPVGAHIYVCGPQGFIESVLATARTTGFPEVQLHREFFAASHDTAPRKGFEIQIASTGAVLQVGEEQSVADVLQSAGILIPISCDQGVCGSCITRVLDGQPEHRDCILDDAERASNSSFTPCCSRSLSPRLVLDL